MQIEAHKASGQALTVSGERPWAMRSLPPFPAVALQLIGLLDSETPIKEITRLLRVDPALSAEILRVANSALYGLSRRIDNVGHAVVILGTDAVSRLALTAALGKFAQNFLNDEVSRACWDHSVACAVTAEKLGEEMNLPKDRLYTAGLLHDLGRLALLAAFPVEYSNLIEAASDREGGGNEFEDERNLFDIDHCQAGEWLAVHWNFPTDIVEAIAQHHGANVDEPTIVSAVAAAHRITNALGFTVVQRPAAETVDGILRLLPVEDVEAAIESFADLRQHIEKVLSIVTPAK
jgi:putative nucleotidyltransferase with HDIG domain